MIDIDQLDDKFSIEGELGFAELENDLVFITVSNKFADADICLYGAHITSFRPHNSIDILWMSEESNFEFGKPIRGGIPVCFPWFGQHKTNPEFPQHGFARLIYWDVVSTATNSLGETEIKLSHISNAETKSFWPYDYLAEIFIVVGQKLRVSLKITNKSTETINYTCALHSYFNLSAIENITIDGLKGVSYYNQLTNDYGIQNEDKLEILEATTRHYLNTESYVVIEDNVFRRRIRVDKAGSKVTTVWNPWIETCTAISDLADDSFETFVCVEAINAFEYPVTIAPGESFETSAFISIE